MSHHRARSRARGDDGAVLVEFALLAPVLFLVLFGIIEFGWMFLQNLDVRHGAREGARLTAVNYNPNGTSGATQTSDIVAEICNRLDKKSGVSVQLTVTSAARTIGGTVSVTITKNPVETLTGFLNWAIPTTLTSTVQTRLEQSATWSDTLGSQACP